MKCGKSKLEILNFIDLTGLGIGNSIGIGIFVLSGELAKNVAGPAVVVSILISAVAAILTGLCFAEFATRFFNADTAYTYSYSCRSEIVSFVFGWALILQFIAGSASVAKGVMVFVDALAENRISKFLQDLVPGNETYGFSNLDFFSPIILIFLTVSLAFGMTDSTPIKNVFTFFTVLLLVSVIVAGSFRADPSNWRSGGIAAADSAEKFFPFGILGVFEGAAIGFYSFVGFETIGASGREAKKPQTYIPFAFCASLSIITVVYCCSGAILTLLTPYSDVNVGAALPFAFEKINWIEFKWIIAVGAFSGFYTSLIGVTFPIPKILYSMASDGLLFNFLTRKSARFETPLAAIATAGFMTAIAAAIFTFQILVNLTIFATLFVSTVLAIDIILLRYKHQNETTEIAPEESGNFSVSKIGILTAKQSIKIWFHVNVDVSNEIIEKIVIVNLISFCVFSAGFGVVFAFFNDYLATAKIEAILPAAIFVAFSLFAVASMACQPKSEPPSPFKVPLVPFLPCLCIFLNILMMALLGSLTAFFFSIWMAAGILLHFFRHAYDYIRGNTGKNFLFEINKSNSLKLSESIWRINSEKNIFYDGAVNPVFEEDEELEAKENDGNEEKGISFASNGKTINSEASGKIRENRDNNKSPIFEHSPVKDETVQWEFAAEIHSEGKFSNEESYELQVVDNNYEFLTRMMDEDSNPKKKKEEEEGEKGVEGENDLPAISPYSSPSVPKYLDGHESAKIKSFSGKSNTKFVKSDEVWSEKANELNSEMATNDDCQKNVSQATFSNGKYSAENNLITKSEEEKEFQRDSICWESEKKFFGHLKSEKNDGENRSRKSITSDSKEETERKEKDEQIKQFKEKLNFILKNQLNKKGEWKKIISKNIKISDVDKFERRFDESNVANAEKKYRSQN